MGGHDVMRSAEVSRLLMTERDLKAQRRAQIREAMATDPARIGKVSWLDGVKATAQFLGDSLQWREQHRDLFSAGALVIHTDDGRELFGSELRFPDHLVADARLFDRLVEELSRRAATSRAGRPAPSLAAVFSRLAARFSLSDCFAGFLTSLDWLDLSVMMIRFPSSVGGLPMTIAQFHG